jgi:fructose-1,6-bisphosphatase/inositol monophosphatase family enzyme
VTPEQLIGVFDRAFDAQRAALLPLSATDRRARTDRTGQYHLDTIADAAVLPILHEAGVRVLSEESGWTGPTDAEVTIVLDPVDGSTNCARNIPYWSISLCALDGAGMLVGYVANGATGVRYTAIRGEGAWVDGKRIQPSTTRALDRSVIAITGLPPHRIGWRQFRALGSSALSLCDVAAGNVDGFLDCLPDQHRPWDYLGGLLVCREAGAVVVDGLGRDLVIAEEDGRRRLVGAGTPELLDVLLAELERA